MLPHHIINDADFWSRMDNWYRAVHVGIAYATCGSMEKRYRSPQVWDAQQPNIPVDRPDADALEEAWRGLPMDCRLIVRYWWIRKMRPELIGRKMKIRPRMLDAEIRRAILLMHTRLEKTIEIASAIVYKQHKPEFTV
jgi:hypothetical protein